MLGDCISKSQDSPGLTYYGMKTATLSMAKYQLEDVVEAMASSDFSSLLVARLFDCPSYP
jgi:hypothetical protein